MAPLGKLDAGVAVASVAIVTISAYSAWVAVWPTAERS